MNILLCLVVGTCAVGIPIPEERVLGANAHVESDDVKPGERDGN